MANIKAAQKSIRSSARKRGFNDRSRRAMKQAVKSFKEAVSTSKDEAAKMLPQVYKAIDKAAKGGVIKANTASRKKSRLTKLLK